MYGRLSVFLSLLVFACAVPIHLQLENVPVFVVNEIAVEEGVLSNRVYLPIPPPMPGHRSSGSQKRVFALLRRGTKSIEIVPSSRQMEGGGSYVYAFESADDNKISESDSQKKVGPKPEDIGTPSRGTYSFTSPDGVVLTVNWIADENELQATGGHLLTAPPMPEHIVKRLADFKAAGVLFKSADGTKVSESGRQKQVGPKPEDIGTVSRGSYSYTSPDGVVITVNWIR